MTYRGVTIVILFLQATIEDMFHLIILKDEKLNLKMLRFLFYDTGFFETHT